MPRGTNQEVYKGTTDDLCRGAQIEKCTCFCHWFKTRKRAALFFHGRGNSAISDACLTSKWQRIQEPLLSAVPVHAL